jgi:hypothetical protein
VNLDVDRLTLRVEGRAVPDARRLAELIAAGLASVAATQDAHDAGALRTTVTASVDEPLEATASRVTTAVAQALSRPA